MKELVFLPQGLCEGSRELEHLNIIDLLLLCVCVCQWGYGVQVRVCLRVPQWMCGSQRMTSWSLLSSFHQGAHVVVSLGGSTIHTGWAILLAQLSGTFIPWPKFMSWLIFQQRFPECGRYIFLKLPFLLPGWLCICKLILALLTLGGVV